MTELYKFPENEERYEKIKTAFEILKANAKRYSISGMQAKVLELIKALEGQDKVISLNLLEREEYESEVALLTQRRKARQLKAQVKAYGMSMI